MRNMIRHIHFNELGFCVRISVYLRKYIFSCRQINYKFLYSCCDYIEMGLPIQDIYGTYHHEKPDTEGFIRVISILKISSGVKTFTFDIDLDSELMMVPTVQKYRLIVITIMGQKCKGNVPFTYFVYYTFLVKDKESRGLNGMKLREEINSLGLKCS